jgi:tetratricopeptide (TPR) repeat protein
VTARRWLDWTREITTAGGSLDDPLSGELFARFWTKGQQADDLALRRAAVALVHETAYAKKIADKMPELFATSNPSEQPKFLLIRAAVAENAQRWGELEPLSIELLKLFPESKVAAGFNIRAALQLKHFALAENTIKPFAERDPRDRWVASMRSMLEQFRGDFDAAQKVLAPVVEDGTATPEDLNSYAWLSLFTKAGVDKAALDAGERGTHLSKNNYAIMHTVACQYAEIGRGREGYKLLMDAMKAISRDEPMSSDWYALARIAESYGETEAALAMYKKVEHDEDTPFFPTDTYLLAERGVKRLSPASGTSAAKGAK